MSTVVVTGVAGFIGGHLVRALAERGDEVVGLDHRAPPASLPLRTFLQVELTDAAATREAVRASRPDVVYHLAAQSSVVISKDDPIGTAEANIMGSVALAEGAAAAGTRRFVFFSTGGAMYGAPAGPVVTEDDAGTPRSMYGASKLAAEHTLAAIADLRGLELSVLRPGNVYGPGQDGRGPSGIIAIFSDRMLRGEPVTIYGDGGEVRDYVHVDDVVRAAILAAEREPATCHVSTGLPTTNLEVFRMVAQHTGYDQEPDFQPARPGEIRGATLSPARARERWAWEPRVALDEGVAQTVAWCRERIVATAAV